jgi:hypothetical protein
MIRADLVREIQALPFQEQFEMLEYLARSLRQQSQVHLPSGTTPRNLAAAAEALRADYQNDPDLTAFTALDSEDFARSRGSALKLVVSSDGTLTQLSHDCL